MSALTTMPKHCTLYAANTRRSERFFEDAYRYLYTVNKSFLSSDNQRGGTEEWISQLHIHRLHDHHAILQRYLQGCGAAPGKKGGIGSFRNTHQRLVHARSGLL